MKSKKIIVVGSTNMDMVVKTDHIPAPGETVLSGSFFMNPGGKGANQAVTISRLGGEVVFITKLGNDIFGRQFSQLFEGEGINTSFLISDENLPSGVALITVDKAGENSIVVASGANAQLNPEDIKYALSEIGDAAFLLLQLEIPMHTVEYVIDYAYRSNVRVILNPAPANSLSEDLLSKVNILTPNEKEASDISGIKVNSIDTAYKAARIICAKGVQKVVITMGSMGAAVCEAGNCYSVPSVMVTAVDSTAAGDVFNGALAVALSEDKDLKEAVTFACEAAAISVTRMGAQSSIPNRIEVVAQKLHLKKNSSE
jgi:ribokinase